MGGGGGGGRGPGTVDGPINIDSDVETDDDNGSSESEPDGTFAAGSTRDSPGRGQTEAAKFIGRERKSWFSKTSLGPLREGAGADPKAGMVGGVHRSYAGPRRAQVVVGGKKTLRPGTAARRQTGRRRLAQQVGLPVPKHTELGTCGHVQTQTAKSPVARSFVAAAEHLETKAKWRRPAPLCKGPDRGRRVQEEPPLFLEFMQALTPHLHWIAEREGCSLWMVVKRVDLWLNRVFDTAEDFRLRGALPALSGALRKLQPESWEACLHINTSPVPRVVGGLKDAILDKGLRPIGAQQLPADLWDAVIPPFYRGGLQDFDVEREWQDGERVVRGASRGISQHVQRIVQALRGAGVYEETADPSPPPTCYPFVIPKSSEKVSLILSCVKINKSDGAKPPTFRLDSWEDLARSLSAFPPDVDLYGVHIDLKNAFSSFCLPPEARRIFRFRPAPGAPPVALSRLPFGWNYRPYLCQTGLARVLRGVLFPLKMLNSLAMLTAVAAEPWQARGGEAWRQLKAFQLGTDDRLTSSSIWIGDVIVCVDGARDAGGWRVGTLIPGVGVRTHVAPQARFASQQTTELRGLAWAVRFAVRKGDKSVTVCSNSEAAIAQVLHMRATSHLTHHQAVLRPLARVLWISGIVGRLVWVPSVLQPGDPMSRVVSVFQCSQARAEVEAWRTWDNLLSNLGEARVRGVVCLRG